MARRKSQAELDEKGMAQPGAGRRPGLRFILQFGFLTFALVITVFGAAWVLWQGEQFLIDDPRFRLAESEPGVDDRAIIVEGAHRASREAVLRVFDEDRGRSLYKLAPEERRRALRQVEWVRDATVRRHWPNRVAVTIEERIPVAFIQVPFRASGSAANPISYRPMLIDADGMILRVRNEVPPDLPLLSGVRAGDPAEVRRERVKLMRRLLDELREVRSHIVEIDVSHPDNVRVAYEMHQQIYLLVLGNERFRERLGRFVNGYHEWKDRIPERAVVDLTHETRIVASPVEGASQ